MILIISGSVEMSAEILLHLDLPKQGDQQQYFRNYIYLTQVSILQAIVISYCLISQR